MICKNCGKEVAENQAFCGNCGSKIEQNNVAKNQNVHWIQKTQLAKYLSNHNGARQLLAISIIIVILVLIIMCITSLSDLTSLSNAYEANRYTNYNGIEQEITMARFKLIGSIILIPIIWYYGSKLTSAKNSK